MTVTGNSTRGDDRINSSHLNSSAHHSPECFDIAERQAEHDGQKRTLESPHRGRLARVIQRGESVYEGTEKGGKPQESLGKSWFCSYR